MIMLPLHGQNTAARQHLNVSGQAILQKLKRKKIFVKQADMKNLSNSSKESMHPKNNVTNKIY
jgi:hypothetical protein